MYTCESTWRKPLLLSTDIFAMEPLAFSCSPVFNIKNIIGQNTYFIKKLFKEKIDTSPVFLNVLFLYCSIFDIVVLFKIYILHVDFCCKQFFYPCVTDYLNCLFK